MVMYWTPDTFAKCAAVCASALAAAEYAAFTSVIMTFGAAAPILAAVAAGVMVSHG